MVKGLPVDEPGAGALLVGVLQPGGVLGVLGLAVCLVRGLDPPDGDVHLLGELLDLGRGDLRDHFVGDLKACVLSRGTQFIDRLLGDVADPGGGAACILGAVFLRVLVFLLLSVRLILVLFLFLGGLGPVPQRRRKGGNTELGVGPREERALVRDVWDLLQAGDLLEPLADLLVEARVLGVDRLWGAGGVGALFAWRLG